MISARYVPAACVLVTLALVPTLIHSYAFDTETNARTTTGIPEVLAGYPSAATDRHPTWGQRRFDTNDWVERDYRVDGQSVRLTVVRSYDAKSVYHHPELAVAYRTGFTGARIHRFAERPEVPVHLLTPAPGVRASAMYVLQYESRFIDNPIAFQIRQAGELLFSRRRPMTLFFVTSSTAPTSEPFEPVAAVRLLFSALDALPNDRISGMEQDADLFTMK